MRVLLLSVTAGEGHNSTGKAILNGLKSRGIEAEMLDTYQYISPLLGGTVSKGYLVTSQVTPSAYRLVYNLAEHKEKNTSKYSLGNFMNSFLANKLEDYIYSYAPQCIICTHIFAAQIINRMKLAGKLLDIPTIGIVTDFCIHPFWPDIDRVEYIVTASELIGHEAMRKGIEPERLLPIGIPVQEKFSRRGDPKEARAALGLDQDRFTVLVMSGSMGYGDITEVVREVEQLDMNLQIICVCGNNKKAKEQIDHMEHVKPIQNHGFVHNVDEMMDAADCIITKPGGITTSEALSKGLPIIMMNPIPGQEDRNAEFLVNNGVAMLVSKTAPLGDVIYQMFYFKERLDNMRDNIRRVGKPHATEDLCAFVEKQIRQREEKQKTAEYV